MWVERLGLSETDFNTREDIGGARVLVEQWSNMEVVRIYSIDGKTCRTLRFFDSDPTEDLFQPVILYQVPVTEHPSPLPFFDSIPLPELLYKKPYVSLRLQDRWSGGGTQFEFCVMGGEYGFAANPNEVNPEKHNIFFSVPLAGHGLTPSPLSLPGRDVDQEEHPSENPWCLEYRSDPEESASRGIYWFLKVLDLYKWQCR